MDLCIRFYQLLELMCNPGLDNFPFQALIYCSGLDYIPFQVVIIGLCDLYHNKVTWL